MDLDLSSLRNGDRLVIDGVGYEVISVRGEAFPAPGADPPFRYCVVVSLHDHATQTISPTHELMWFSDDTGELFLNEVRWRPVRREDLSVVRSAHDPSLER